MKTLLKNAILNGQHTDIVISGNRIESIGNAPKEAYGKVLDCTHMIAVPPFYNLHAHSSMSLLRGYADDLELMDWLQNHIWPAEGRLVTEDYYWGTKLACLEMIHSGTVFFCDMYFKPEEALRAVDEMGMRAAIGMTILDTSPLNEQYRKDIAAFWSKRASFPSRIQVATTPHAVYTVTAETLQQCAELSRKEQILLHIHLAETEFEVQQCKAEHQGMSPVEYLESLGVLSPLTIAAHSVHLTEHDMDILSERGVTVVFNPCSNLKLCSGLFPFRKLLERGINVALGTDGNASNNNLSMFDEMKVAALVAKLSHGSPTGATAEEIFKAATVSGAKAMKLDAGILAAGKLADILLLDADSPLLTPSFNLISNLVYSADTSCVNSVICDGKILMENRIVPGEAEIIENARRCAMRLKE